jgi:hypothetical protein
MDQKEQPRKFFERKPGRTRFRWLKDVGNNLLELKEGGKWHKHKGKMGICHN